ncbi:MAG TPA: response regulator [Polyangiaceae bacterium]|jgi:CheY-like chemotaxis protein/CHASE3 domain sensor protein
MKEAAKPRSSLPLPPATLVGLAAAIFAVLGVAFAEMWSADNRTAANDRVAHAFQVDEHLALLLSAMKDAETGERGFLLTGEERYLEPYNNAKGKPEAELRALRALTADSASQQQRLDGIEAAFREKLADITGTIDLRRRGDSVAALAALRGGQGKAVMDKLRLALGDMEIQEKNVLDARVRQAEDAAALGNLVRIGGSTLLLVLIGGAAFLLSRDYRARAIEAWLKDGQAGVLLESQGEKSLEGLAEGILAFLARSLDALAGTIYAVEDAGGFRRVAGMAMAPTPSDGPALVRTGEGLVGEAIKERRTIHVRDVPPGYLSVSSGLGRAEPRDLVVVPLLTDGRLMGVVELAFFRAVGESDLAFLDRVSESIAFAISSSKYKTRLRELLEESRRQTEQLQTQQAELEAQQAELEASNEEMNQANALMEVQTQELEKQRDEVVLARDVADKASRYKSEFLANMSHELRTPLNSSLILARLLADNKEGNLSADQVQSAETIYGAGNDLLVLINDILDLSKIEAGRADIAAESVPVARIVKSLEQSFRPIADEKGVRFRITRMPGSPVQIVTDARRLEQILKNLLSNAFKFTEAGEVELTVAAAPDARVVFSVRDTGIGIATHQTDVIFEAFRQADGTTSRKYGGTGLGLSISRELARLLGGAIAVESTLGEGSVFTLDLPVAGPVAVGTSDGPARAVASASNGARRLGAPAGSKPPARPAAAPPFPDDRGQLTRSGRLILAVEDDAAFARVLFDLAHELDFDCVVAPTAEDGLHLARELQPSGILLDIGLPDASGLSVLERLKRDPATRHVPIHVVSASDNAQTAFELGAVGYAVKPVARGELVGAIRKLEERHAREVRRVLVVEDDERQRESIQKLLRGNGVELITAGTVKDALATLEHVNVDCMVLDLTLPDGTGYDVLERMVDGTRYSFPPVIVYTGRELDRADEQRLRRYSRSIIVKGARSPERLLDEVTLFLHQVESSLPPEQRRILEEARHRDDAFAGRRILVVEDDVRNVFALSKVFEPRGAKTEIARNGREALDLLARSPDIDLVLMDLMMPEMDGLTAIREIRKRDEFRRLPIIALTAKAMADDREQAMSAGANDYMAKPFEVDKLISLCRVWLPR